MVEFTYTISNSPKPRNLFGGNASCSLQLEPAYLLRVEVPCGESNDEFGFTPQTHRIVRGMLKEPDRFINEIPGDEI